MSSNPRAIQDKVLLGAVSISGKFGTSPAPSAAPSTPMEERMRQSKLAREQRSQNKKQQKSNGQTQLEFAAPAPSPRPNLSSSSSFSASNSFPPSLNPNQSRIRRSNSSSSSSSSSPPPLTSSLMSPIPLLHFVPPSVSPQDSPLDPETPIEMTTPYIRKSLYHVSSITRPPKNSISDQNQSSEEAENDVESPQMMIQLGDDDDEEEDERTFGEILDSEENKSKSENMPKLPRTFSRRAAKMAETGKKSLDKDEEDKNKKKQTPSAGGGKNSKRKKQALDWQSDEKDDNDEHDDFFVDKSDQEYKERLNSSPVPAANSKKRGKQQKEAAAKDAPVVIDIIEDDDDDNEAQQKQEQEKKKQKEEQEKPKGKIKQSSSSSSSSSAASSASAIPPLDFSAPFSISSINNDWAKLPPPEVFNPPPSPPPVAPSPSAPRTRSRQNKVIHSDSESEQSETENQKQKKEEKITPNKPTFDLNDDIDSDEDLLNPSWGKSKPKVAEEEEHGSRKPLAVDAHITKQIPAAADESATFSLQSPHIFCGPNPVPGFPVQGSANQGVEFSTKFISFWYESFGGKVRITIHCPKDIRSILLSNDAKNYPYLVIRLKQPLSQFKHLFPSSIEGQQEYPLILTLVKKSSVHDLYKELTSVFRFFLQQDANFVQRMNKEQMERIKAIVENKAPPASSSSSSAAAAPSPQKTPQKKKEPIVPPPSLPEGRKPKTRSQSRNNSSDMSAETAEVDEATKAKRKQKAIDDAVFKFITQQPEEKIVASYNGIYLKVKDFARLQEEVYLNDLLLDFWMLRYLEKLPENMRKRIHVFNTTFWNSLVRNFERVAERFDRTVDVFDKDILFIPLNESEHWTLLVVCNPGALMKEFEEKKAKEKEEASESRQKELEETAEEEQQRKTQEAAAAAAAAPVKSKKTAGLKALQLLASSSDLTPANPKRRKQEISSSSAPAPAVSAARTPQPKPAAIQPKNFFSPSSSSAKKSYDLPPESDDEDSLPLKTTKKRKQKEMAAAAPAQEEEEASREVADEEMAAPSDSDSAAKHPEKKDKQQKRKNSPVEEEKAEDQQQQQQEEEQQQQQQEQNLMNGWPETLPLGGKCAFVYFDSLGSGLNREASTKIKQFLSRRYEFSQLAAAKNQAGGGGGGGMQSPPSGASSFMSPSSPIPVAAASSASSSASASSSSSVQMFTKETCKTYRTNVPSQQNWTDCGVYLLKYFMIFCKHPIPYLPKANDIARGPVTIEGHDWFSMSDVANMSLRREIQKEIIQMRQEQDRAARPSNLPPAPPAPIAAATSIPAPSLPSESLPSPQKPSPQVPLPQPRRRPRKLL